MRRLAYDKRAFGIAAAGRLELNQRHLRLDEIAAAGHLQLDDDALGAVDLIADQDGVSHGRGGVDALSGQELLHIAGDLVGR